MKEEEEKLQHNTSLSMKPHYCLQMESRDSSMNAKCSMVEDSAEVMIREYFSKSPVPISADPLEC